MVITVVHLDLHQ